MRFVVFASGGARHLGVVRDGEILDLHDLAADVCDLIRQGEDGLALVSARLRNSRRGSPLDEGILHAPIDPPCDVLAVGLNYQQHADEHARATGGESKPPTIFTKATTSLVGPADDVRLDETISSKFDWEVELGVIIGRSGSNIRSVNAARHIFGYTVINDVSARDLQHGWGGQWFKGKSVDATSPIGPWIVTAEEVTDPQNLQLTLRVNGDTKQLATTAEMIYSVSDLIEWMSFGMTLRSGTLIATGTPAGVGNARTPPEYLRPGDLMETEISELGVLRNRIVAAHNGAPLAIGTPR